MDFSELVRRRRSIRKVRSGQIDDETIMEILEAGRWAPSPVNVQPWKLIVMKERNREFWDFVANVYVDRPRALEDIARYRDCIFTILIYQDNRRVLNAIEEGQFGKMSAEMIAQWVAESMGCLEENLFLAVYNASLAASLQHKAGSLDGPIREFLNLPEDLELISIMPVGFADESGIAERRPLTEVVCIDRWAEDCQDFEETPEQTLGRGWKTANPWRYTR